MIVKVGAVGQVMIVVHAFFVTLNLALKFRQQAFIAMASLILLQLPGGIYFVSSFLPYFRKKTKNWNWL